MAGARRRNVQSWGQEEGHNGQSKGLEEEEAIKYASAGWIKYFVCVLTAVLVLPVLIFLLLPSPLQPVAMETLPEPPELTGVMSPNNLLEKVERLYQGELEGPESLVVDGDHIYTGTADGCVTHIHQGQVRCLVRFGRPPCGGYSNENTCGRPLGLRMTRDGYLIALDAYHGIFKVNVATGDYETLYSASTPFKGRKFKFFNDLDLGDDGKIYFTDTSTRWHRNQFVNVVCEGAGTGSLNEFNPTTGKMRQLMHGLIFANGVQFTKDKKSLLVTDTVAAKIYKYNLVTDTYSVWAENFPGLPDNIRYCRRSGTYWVGVGIPRYRGNSLVDSLAAWPWVRGQIGKIVSVSNLQTFMTIFGRTPITKSQAVEMSEQGKIIRSLQDRHGKVMAAISEVACSDSAFYFGSYKANFLGRLYKRQLPF